METPNSSEEEFPKPERKPHLNNEQSIAYLEYVKSKRQEEVVTESTDNDYKEFVARKKEVDFFAKAGASPYIMNTFTVTMKMYDGNWKNSINNPSFVKAVGSDVTLQNNLLLTGELKTPYVMKDNRLGIDTAPDDIAFKMVNSTEKKNDSEPGEPGEAVFASMANQLSKYGEKNSEGKKEDNSLDFVEYAPGEHKAIAQEYTDAIVKSNANPEIIVNNSSSKEQEAKKNDEVDDMSFAEMASGVEYGSLSSTPLKNTDSKKYEVKPEKLDTDIENQKGNIVQPGETTAQSPEISTGLDLGKMEQDAKDALKNSVDYSAVKHLQEMKQAAEARQKKADWEIKGPIENWGEDPGFVRPFEQITQNAQKVEKVEDEPKIDENQLLEAQQEVKKLQEALTLAQERVKKIEETMEVRKKGVLGRLGAMGIKSLDYYRSMKPRNKIILGIALAGASVLTGGGVAGLVAGGAMKAFATATNARGFYQAIEKAEKEENGKEVNKKWLAARSIAYGALLAAGTSMLFSEIASHFAGAAPVAVDVSPASPDVSTPGSIAAVTPEAAPGVVVAPESVIVPPAEEIIDTQATESMASPAVENAQPEDVENMYSTPEIFTDTMSPINLDQTYVMQPGDNTDSILRRVLNTVPELNALPEEGKLKFIGDLKEQWSTPISGASTPNWALKEMIGGATGTEVHHLDHVKDAFVTLGERADVITTYRN